MRLRPGEPMNQPAMICLPCMGVAGHFLGCPHYEEPAPVMEGPHAAARQAFMEKMPPRVRGTYARGMAGGRAAGVKAFCLQCCGWSAAEVRKCTAVCCPLWELRPFKDE